MLGNQQITLETNRIAKQADASVVVYCGETMVMANICAAKTQKPDIDFFPLTVNYQEKYYASGKIPGGFFKREARPTERETLISRLIDRPIRPLFHKNFKNYLNAIISNKFIIPKYFCEIFFFLKKNKYSNNDHIFFQTTRNKHIALANFIARIDDNLPNIHYHKLYAYKAVKFFQSFFHLSKKRFFYLLLKHLSPKLRRQNHRL